VLAAALAILCGPAAAVSGADPHLNIAHVAWTSSHGTCSLDGEIATVSGVPSAVKRRIDAAFARALDGQSEYTPSDSAADREAACGFDRVTIAADWTRGRTRGRWLSARYHVRTSYQHEPRPADDYAAVTFDLANGGTQVPTSGFYPAAHRQSFNSAIAAAAIAREPCAAVAIRKISQHLKIQTTAYFPLMAAARRVFIRSVSCTSLKP